MGTASDDGIGVGELWRSRGGGSTCRVGVACILALCLALVVIAPATASTSYVDGISDQHLQGWAGNFSEASGFNTPFPSFFADAWVGSPPSHIKLSRYVVQWDVMRGVGYSGEFTNLTNWYNHTIELGLTPELALANYGCSGCVAPERREYITRELEALRAPGAFPGISYVEAWNEPNHSGSFFVSAENAAHYMDAAYAYCVSHGCTAIAGDFNDSDPNLVRYEEEYKEKLSPTEYPHAKDPGNWGIHPYANTKYGAERHTVEEFQNKLPNKSIDGVWFTEVGAYYCQHGTIFGAGSQESNAKYLVNTLIPTFHPVHVFYYQVAGFYDEPPTCNANADDTALYAAQSSNGPVLARPAAGVVYGPEGPPTASTGSASAIQETQATIGGSVNPQGIDDAKYYFQYGTSTSYGSSTPLSDAGPGLNPVSEAATITGLQPGAIYHYRIVTTSAAGKGEGSDKTFTTPLSVFAYFNESDNTVGELYGNGFSWNYAAFSHLMAAGTSPAVVRDPSTGQQWVYFNESDNMIGELYWSGSSWAFAEYAHLMAPGTSPAVVRSQSTGEQWIFFTQSDNTLGEFYWNGSSWAYYAYNHLIAAGTSPAVVRDQSTGELWVYFNESDNMLGEFHWSGSSWGFAEYAHLIAAGTSPTVVRDPSNGMQWLFFNQSDNTIGEFYWNGSTWAYSAYAHLMAPRTSPTVVRDPATDQLWLYFTESDDMLGEFYWNGSSWGFAEYAHLIAPETSPATVRDSSTGEQWVMFNESDNTIGEFYWSGSTWTYSAYAHLMAPKTNLALVTSATGQP